MFGLGPIELVVVFFMVAAMGLVAGMVIRGLTRPNPRSPNKCPHCGKDLS